MLAGIEPTIRLDLDNEPQPDAVLLLEAAVGGGARLTQDGYLEGTPELIAEIAASSAAIDMGSKKQAYRRNGVQEYTGLICPAIGQTRCHQNRGLAQRRPAGFE